MAPLALGPHASPREPPFQGLLDDPLGPRWLHIALPAVASTLLLLSAWSCASADAGPRGSLFLAAALFFGLSKLFPRPFQQRPASFTVSSGAVTISGAGLLSQTIRARDVGAVSTASTDNGIEIAIAARGRHLHPIRITVASADHAARICDALGVGVHGVGSLSWPTYLPPGATLDVVAGVGLTASSLALMLGGHHGPLIAFGGAIFPLALIVAVLGLLTNRSPRFVTLRPGDVHLSTSGTGWDSIPYNSIDRVDVTDDGINLVLSGNYPSVLVPFPRPRLAKSATRPDEVAHIAAQIRCAMLRSKGFGPDERTVDDEISTRLARGGSSASEWLARIDAFAHELGGSSPYRGHAVSREDLWQTLGNHDASLPLRVAAARVLYRVDPEQARLRVPEIAATLREQAAVEAIGLTQQEDVDADELEALADRFADGRKA